MLDKMGIKSFLGIQLFHQISFIFFGVANYRRLPNFLVLNLGKEKMRIQYHGVGEVDSDEQP